MKECSKSIQRRLGDPRFISRYFVGNGVDIGGKPDPLSLYRSLFPLMESIRTWDLEDGDAQLLDGVSDESLDFVHSSHCLEHLCDPVEALENWFRVLKPEGYLVFTIPDEDLYEQRIFPSFNSDHKHTFTIYKRDSWSKASINLLDLLRSLGPDAEVQKIELLDATYRYALPVYDQTLTPVGESAIEVVVRRRTPGEVRAGGRLPQPTEPDRETRIHLNQYRDDAQTLKRNNSERPPFFNDRDL